MLRSSILLWELRGASKEGEEGTGTGGGVGARRRYSMSPAGVKGRLSVLMHTCLLTLHGSTMEYKCMLGPTLFEFFLFICQVPILANVWLNAYLHYNNCIDQYASVRCELLFYSTIHKGPHCVLQHLILSNYTTCIDLFYFCWSRKCWNAVCYPLWTLSNAYFGVWVWQNNLKGT